MLMRFRVIFVESQKWEMMIVNNDAFFASVIDLLREGKRVTIPVKGTSMLPFIVAERDLVVLEGRVGLLTEAMWYCSASTIITSFTGCWILPPPVMP